MTAGHRIRRRLCAVLSTALLGGGCAGGDSAGRGSATAQIDTLENGRVRVVNTGPAWTDEDAWTAEEELRLGTVTGEGPEQFSEIAALEADAEGRIYVLDYQSQSIRVFDADGVYSHTIGRQGEGPGEMMQGSGLNWGPEGNLWVWDARGRFSIFTPEGEFVDSRLRRVAGVIFPWRGEFDTDGSLIDWGLEFQGWDRGPTTAPERVVYHPIRFSGDFSRGDSLAPLVFVSERGERGERMVFAEGLAFFQDRKGALWFARNKTFTVYRRTLEGDTTLEFSIDAAPAAVAQSDVDSVAAVWAEMGLAESAPGPEGFTATKPIIRRIFADGAGHVFVLSEQHDLPLGTFVDVFREDGRYLGRLDLPTSAMATYPPPHATDTHLYYVTTDELGVEYVVRVRLEKPGA